MKHASTLPTILIVGLIVLIAPGTIFAARGIVPTNFGDMEPVLFDHTRHAEDLGCSDCHHNSSSSGARGSHRCGYCHLEESKLGVLSMEDAAHEDQVGKCWDCHLKEEARHELDCEDCHSG